MPEEFDNHQARVKFFSDQLADIRAKLEDPELPHSAYKNLMVAAGVAADKLRAEFSDAQKASKALRGAVRTAEGPRMSIDAPEGEFLSGCDFEAEFKKLDEALRKEAPLDD